MSIKILKSGDGSDTLFNDTLNETYHSVNGAFTESQHVFIKNGLSMAQSSEITVFEIGFGTGLNALLSYDYFFRHPEIKKINYYSIELYPLHLEMVDSLNYGSLENIQVKDLFKDLHRAEWGKEIEIRPGFTLCKILADITTFSPTFLCDVVYFDAFAPDIQPLIWKPEVFDMLFKRLKLGGVFATYSAKGQVRRDLQQVGFRVERRPGPPGKREIIVAFKEDVSC